MITALILAALLAAPDMNPLQIEVFSSRSCDERDGLSNCRFSTRDGTRVKLLRNRKPPNTSYWSVEALARGSLVLFHPGSNGAGCLSIVRGPPESSDSVLISPSGDVLTAGQDTFMCLR
jgi:hypothetical protein